MTRTAKSLPNNVWTPAPGASIMVYWRRLDDISFEVALQLIDPEVLSPSDDGIMLQVMLDPLRPRQAFSLREEQSPARLLSGRFECRQTTSGPAQLWLIDAQYPGGTTASAQIA